MASDILEEFIFDSREHLANAGTQLMALEKDPQSLADLNALMGTLHTIKGNSGFLNQKNLYNLLHAAESLLQTVRENACACSTAVVEKLFQVLDTVEVILDRLENGESDEVDWLATLSESLKESEETLESSAPQSEPTERLASSDHSYYDHLDSNNPPSSLLESDYNLKALEPPSPGQLLTLANGQLAELGQAFLASCHAAISTGQASLALDLTNLSQFSSPELELLVSLGQAYGPGLALVLDQEQQPDFFRVLEVWDLVASFRLYPDAPSALSALGH
ncbi:MAG: Hpt domain-containing protein [Deltaproteobacteria bacterium]|jgi:chemotaxis protein histidine kinase CheA|nr:Hpt domain-containing protein [Deltaproteobacteria bacterium]